MMILAVLILIRFVPGHLGEPVVTAAAGLKLIAVARIDLVERVEQRVILVLPELCLGQQPGVAVGNNVHGISFGSGRHKRRRTGQQDRQRKQQSKQFFHGVSPPVSYIITRWAGK